MNLSLCSNVQVTKECNGNFIDDPQKLNLEQVSMAAKISCVHLIEKLPQTICFRLKCAYVKQ